MDIRYLALTFLAASVAYYFVPVENKNVAAQKVELPQVIFPSVSVPSTSKTINLIIKHLLYLEFQVFHFLLKHV